MLRLEMKISYPATTRLALTPFPFGRTTTRGLTAGPSHTSSSCNTENVAASNDTESFKESLFRWWT